MIKVKVYGYLVRAMGKAELEIDKSEMKVKEILSLISSSKDIKFNLSPLTMLIAVNGVEISALNKEDTVVKSGDEVAFIPITHGG